jgi:hypothetical protein
LFISKVKPSKRRATKPKENIKEKETEIEIKCKPHLVLIYPKYVSSFHCQRGNKGGQGPPLLLPNLLSHQTLVKEMTFKLKREEGTRFCRTETSIFHVALLEEDPCKFPPKRTGNSLQAKCEWVVGREGWKGERVKGGRQREEKRNEGKRKIGVKNA